MFYNFMQNNSGGSFVYDERSGIAVNVIVEAPDALTANIRAEEIGVYFNGCDDGRDCDCCGDRWSMQWGEHDADRVPSVYGQPVVVGAGMPERDFSRKWLKNGEEYEGFIHYMDGRIVGFWKYNEGDVRFTEEQKANEPKPQADPKETRAGRDIQL